MVKINIKSIAINEIKIDVLIQLEEINCSSQLKRSASDEYILQDLVLHPDCKSPFCLWIGLELFIVCHFEEGKFCLIGCEERKGVEIQRIQQVQVQFWLNVHTGKINYI